MVSSLSFSHSVCMSCNFQRTDDSGALQTRVRQTAVHYLGSWFVFDLVTCLPLTLMTNIPELMLLRLLRILEVMNALVCVFHSYCL